MSQDPSKPHDLVRAARDEWGPPPAMAAAVKRATLERASKEVGPSSSTVDGAPGPMPAPAIASRPAALWGALAVVAAGAVAVFALTRPVPPAPQPLAQSTTTAPEPRAPELPAAGPAVPDAIPLESLPDAVAPPRALPRIAPSAAATHAPTAAANASTPDGDTLGEELALVRAAQGAMRDGRAGDALRSLAAHRARFPSGALRDERMTLEVLALCAGGRVDEAKAIRRQLMTVSPGSSHLGRLASSCAAQ